MAADDSIVQGTFWGEDGPRQYCLVCKTLKPPDAFGLQKRRTGSIRRRSECKSCATIRAGKWKKSNPGNVKKHQRIGTLREHGLTPATYRAMLCAQGGVCAICGKAETAKRNGKTAWLSVDHDHGTGRVRQLLCSACNTAIGMFRDDPELLERAAAYLRRHRLPPEGSPL